ncbi:hypothetical protein J6590_025921 [Homalodisca vitripennis]|nr:hypothetical protein J6590_025921 [Homalodisca vitripennis]
MFGQAYTVTSPDQSTVSSRFQNINKRTTMSRPRSPSSSPTRSVPNRNSSTSTDKSLSEKYTNRAYNRQPSPTGRYQSPDVWRKEQTTNSAQQRCHSVVADQIKGKTPVATQKRLVEESRSDVLKKRPVLEVECQDASMRHHPYLRTRPKTADSTKKDDDTRNIESRVMHTVKEVLSRAVVEKGKIDVNNIGTVLNSMTSRLMVSDADNDQKVNIDVEIKKSKTKVNINTSQEDIPARRVRPLAGIVRKEIKNTSNKQLKKGYTKVYSSDNASSVYKGSGKTVERENSSTLIYIDLPDPDCSKFNTMLKNEEQKKRAEKQTLMNFIISRNDGQDNRGEISLSQKDPQKESVVGDCQVNDNQNSHLQKTAEEVRLQNYIESLIRNMKDQLESKHATNMEGLSEDHSVCKSFCICRVCVSNKTSKSCLADSSTSTDDLRESKPSDTELRTCKITQPPSRLTQSKTPIKQRNTESACKVLKRNKNFQPESKVSIGSRSTYSAIAAKKLSNSHTAYSVAPGACEETAEDMYLRRRIPKSPVRKITSKI